MCADIVNQEEEIISVGQLNMRAKRLLEQQFSKVSVLGEISNLARPSSGHIYFTLKDEDGAIRCAMFRNQLLRLNFEPSNGDQFILKGQVSLYAARGDYQLIVSSMQPVGSGDLMHQFEELKKKLDAEGLFAQDIKKNIPEPPLHIGIITSESTAALQDVLTTIKRRAPISQVTIIPATVQGDAAPKTIISALRNILDFNDKNLDNSIDTVIMCRGGGSIEDLWAFNNESLAREIFDFPLPVISGVGHEIDFTIADFVSDLRAPTPTAAAELVTQFHFQLNDQLEACKIQLAQSIKMIVKDKEQDIAMLSTNLKNPLALLREKFQALDGFEIRLSQSVKNRVSITKQQLLGFQNHLQQSNPLKLIDRQRVDILNQFQGMGVQIRNKLKNYFLVLERVETNLNAVSPLAVLDRGYAIILNKSGKAVRSSKDVDLGETISARLAEGIIAANVTEKK